MKRSALLPRLALPFVVAATFISACGGTPAENVDSASTAAGTTTAVQSAETTSTATASTATEAAEAPGPGYVVAWVDSGDLTVGSIDPSSGEYTEVAQFDVGDFAIAPNAPTASDEMYFRRLVSPDYQRAFAQRTVDGDGHVGWVDRDGTFTDLTLAIAGERTDFGGTPTVGGHGFDLLGNFYYSTNDGRQITVSKLAPGAVSGGELLYTSSDYLINPRLMVNGTLSFDSVGCVPTRSDVGLLADGYVWSDGEMIYRRSGVPVDGTVGISCPADDVELLPDTNTSLVRTPVASDDSQKVAFIFEDRDNVKSIYSINSADGSDAIKTVVPSWPSDTAALVDWID